MTDSAANNTTGGNDDARPRPTAVYVISVAAELSGMHPQTLRIYERRGLVTPARTQGGNRRYSDADIAVLRRISDLTNEGMNLEGIRRIMSLEIENTRLRSELEQARSIAVHAIEDAQRSQRGARGAAQTAGNDLVPLKQTVAVFGQRASIFERD